MKVGVIGGGTVGRAIVRSYVEHVNDVRVYDLVPERRNVAHLRAALNVDVTFVCLPETELDGLFGSFPPEDLGTPLVIKSTLPLGTTRRLSQQYRLSELVHSPEFLTARCAITDAQYPARQVIGYPWGFDRSHPVAYLYARRFPDVPIHVMYSHESELVKLIQNSYFAVQVAFWNEANSLAEAGGLSWEVIMASILADGRINRSHTQVPGQDGNYGFGGACLPKDLKLFIQALKEFNLPYDVSRAALVRNLYDRTREAP